MADECSAGGSHEQKQLETLKKVYVGNRLFFMRTNEAQERFLRVKTPEGKTPRRRMFEAGNKVGKTRIGIAEDLSHAWGFRWWLPEDDPDYKINVRIPNIGLICCETMAHSVVEKIEPELRLLMPVTCKWKSKADSYGRINLIRFETDAQGKKCGSTIHIRSYDQEARSFEGGDYDWVHYDEPPPQEHFKAIERGKVSKNAASWFTMTPLREAYLYDIISSKADEDPEIAIVRGEIWDNCRDWCYKCDVTIEENTDRRKVANCPSCGRSLGFIARYGIEEYLKTLDPDEREAREKGIWRHLSGLVYKELDKDSHIYDDFRIPMNWMPVEAIDPHDARATCWLFGAVSPEEIEIYGKLRNRIYFHNAMQLKGSLDDIVRTVKSARALYGYAEPAFVVLDKKHGEKTQIEEKSWQQELERRGIHRIRLSQSSPGDVELGHKVVRQYLRAHYSTLTGETKPGVLFAKEGCSEIGGPIRQMFSYQYKEGKDAPEVKNKDFPDCVRYICMEEPVYTGPEEAARMKAVIAERMKTAYESRRQLGAIQ